jgi:hypothetical protein
MSHMIHRRDLVQLLSGSLGADKAQALVMDAAMALQMSTIEMTYEQAVQLLERIAREPGIIAITAGLAKVRLGRMMKSASASTSGASPAKPPSGLTPSASPAKPPSGKLERPLSGLMMRPSSALLTQALNEAKAASAVASGMVSADDD